MRDANTEPLDGKDLKILDIIHSLEKPRLRLGISKLFMISRILRSFPQWVQYCIIPFTLRNKKAVEDFPILHGYFQSLIDFREIHYIDQKCCIVRVVT